MPHLLRRFALVPFLTVIIAAPGMGADHDLVENKPQPAGDVIKSLKVEEGFSAEVWADGSQVINPVAIDIDERGRLFVAETLRFRIRGVLDVREHMFLYKDDLRSETTADRLANYEKWKDRFPKNYFTAYSERIRLIEDSKGIGRADRSSVYAEGFNDPLDGPASGVLTGDDGTVYLACVPKVWALNGKDGQGNCITRLPAAKIWKLLTCQDLYSLG